jgi:hypothetical protein
MNDIFFCNIVLHPITGDFMNIVPISIDTVFSLGLPVSSTNKTDRYDIAEILLKDALTTIKPNQTKPNQSPHAIVWEIQSALKF